MFWLKHLTVDRAEIKCFLDSWQSAKPWICLPNLETLEYNASTTSHCKDEFHEMALDIKAAIVAAAEGRNHYARVPGSTIQNSGDGDNDEHYDDDGDDEYDEVDEHDDEYDYFTFDNDDDEEEDDEDMEQYRCLIPGKKLHIL